MKINISNILIFWRIWKLMCYIFLYSDFLNILECQSKLTKFYFNIWKTKTAVLHYAFVFYGKSSYFIQHYWIFIIMYKLVCILPPQLVLKVSDIKTFICDQRWFFFSWTKGWVTFQDMKMLLDISWNSSHWFTNTLEGWFLKSFLSLLIVYK